ncbi:ADP/ATP-dependent (S)-NAD(P)H-hydrate dehydratase [uncultured Microbacterium sp.]|uniref:ADP-dependent (S)-NAD(P)H-hydrate dehydratase n=1 Tax=uncultured Microbacterium sp. TaxID=191216 RepID=A0A1Y5P6X0_9MICO|nr:ADP/ATP-dependent (S)-NAD(P)H-hydrate dehydratase [uncultured Microbacterium sp.]SBS74446.1 ADP-dependent (S)-NAD(P)H-hydrate dehydratase [uncultured Microbacterium sp.]
MFDTDEWTSADTAGVLRVPTASDDKYSRGVLGVRTGSDAYPGAAVLGVEAAWRTGLGMVRYLGPDRATDLVLRRRPETVTVDGRVQAWLIGSGTDAGVRSRAETEALRDILTGAEPVVVDAGALDLAPEATAPIIVTPHAREHRRLRDLLGLGEAPDDVTAARETAATLGGVVLLKGAATIVAAPSGWVRVVRAETSWLATAGTGDVLAGALGALVAGAEAARGAEPTVDLAALAAAAAWLHSRAARLASHVRDGGPVTAGDVADALAAAVGGVLSRG